jgi:hypothetical protein
LRFFITLGKTSVAALFGKVLCDLGILSKGEYLLRATSDLVGASLGESEKKTNAVLSAAQGCVLAIDEAYSLDSSNGFSPSGGGGGGDPYRKAVIDTLVEKVQTSPDADRVVFLLGYKEPMAAMFRGANPGFARRFDWSNPIVFEDFTDDELMQILNQHLARKSVRASVAALLEASNVLTKKRRLPNFGNAGDVHNVANAAIARFFERVRGTDPALVPRTLEVCDFHDASAVRETIDSIFRPAMLGCDTLLDHLHKMRRLIDSKRSKGLDFLRSIPFTFVFVGRPGVGKTTAARLLGRAFYALDVLASSEVVSVSATQLQASYVGQTAPLVRSTFRSALGKTLFIDECYRLDPGNMQGHGSTTFMKEAIDEIVTILTEDEFRGKLVVVLAGYTAETRQMLRANQGLASRFPEEVEFATFTADESLQLLRRNLSDKQSYELAPLPDSPAVCAAMQAIVDGPTFASGRDVDTLVTRIELAMMELPDNTTLVPETLLVRLLNDFATARQDQQMQLEKQQRPPPLQHRCTTEGKMEMQDAEIDLAKTQEGEGAGAHAHQGCKTMHVRDAGVSDAVWRQLQIDMANQTEADADADVQARLQKMGVCPQGFVWIRQQGGWRCQAGGHVITDAQFARA